MDNLNGEVLREAIFEVIHNQVKDNNPPETRQTLDRLMAEDHSQEEAMKLIGCVVASEIFEVRKHGQSYDEKRYVAALHALPRLPWANQEE